MSWNYLVLSKKIAVLQHNKQSGFGLIELMVSITIMVIVSAIVLVNHNSFNGAILLRGQAYKIALQTREIQLAAVSATSGDGTGFRSVLGLKFDADATGDTNNKFQIFKDSNGNRTFNANEEYGAQGILDSRFEIREIRAVGAVLAAGKVIVLFERPNFDALFYSTAGVALAVSKIEIDIARVGSTGVGLDSIRTLEITTTGQISVKS